MVTPWGVSRAIKKSHLGGGLFYAAILRAPGGWPGNPADGVECAKERGRDLGEARPCHAPTCRPAPADRLAHWRGPDKSAWDTAWQRFIRAALNDDTITEDERFSLHDLKRKGITDYKGTRHEKQEGSGHRSPGMMDVYDFSLPVVKSSEE